MTKIRPLVPELAEIARSELNEIESLIPQQIAGFRKWIENQPYLKARIDDQFLVAFLRFCKYNPNKAQERIDFYYTYKTTADDMLKLKTIDEKILKICDSGVFISLPRPVGPAGPRIHLTRMGLIDTSVFTVYDLFRYHTLRAEIEINTDDNWNISGVLEVIDFSKVPFSLLRQFESGLFKKMAAFLEFGVPTNLKGTHIVNAAREVQLILSLVRSLMKQKDLLHIHSSLDSLHQSIGKEYLPVEYGGTSGTLEEVASLSKEQFLVYQDYFNEDQKYGIDVKLRQTVQQCDNSTNSTSLFRKLNVD